MDPGLHWGNGNGKQKRGEQMIAIYARFLGINHRKAVQNSGSRMESLIRSFRGLRMAMDDVAQQQTKA